jgi:Ca2+-binding RTX toxin-like protein
VSSTLVEMIRRTSIAVFAIAAGLAPAAIANTSHQGWPKINGQLWINKTDQDTSHTGTAKNDELLGGHGDDVIAGTGGKDVLWGDYKPSGQGTSQHDMLDGGAGNDFIYASHGINDIQGGSGADIIHAHFGRGTIDCGTGHDILFISHKARSGYKVSNCETISYKPAPKGKA